MKTHPDPGTELQFAEKISELMLKHGFAPPEIGETYDTAFAKIIAFVTYLSEKVISE